MTAWSPRCIVCGRFVGWDADWSIPFGGPTDLEPPDEELYCQVCGAESEEHYVMQGWVPTSWVKAAWERRVAARLGFVEVRLPGCAWSVWSKAIPAGWEPIRAVEARDPEP